MWAYLKVPVKITGFRPAIWSTSQMVFTSISSRSITHQAAFEKKGLVDRKPSSFIDRSQLKYARRLVVKLGSAVITREDEHGLALGRLASIVEQVAECQNEGRECIMVTSGAVAFGKQRLTQELLMSLSMRETLSPTDHTREEAPTLVEPRAAAAVGQSGLMSLYDAMFSQYGVKIAQVLVTKADFYNEETRKNLISTLTELISLNIVPIINTNDAVSPPPQIDEPIGGKAGKKGISLKDNDSLAAMLAAEIQSDLLILMSDVDGIYDKPPWEAGAKFLHTFTSNLSHTIEFGQKSKVGTGGMDSKVTSATWALERGVSVIICNGTLDKAIRSIMAGRKVGTFFTEHSLGGPVSSEVVAENGKHTATVSCKNKRDGKQRASQAILQALHPSITSWGSLLRLYGNHSIKSFKEKKLEEQEITSLQSKAAVNQPNYAILSKLNIELGKLREKRKAIQPIGVLDTDGTEVVAPFSSTSNLHNLAV